MKRQNKLALLQHRNYPVSVRTDGKELDRLYIQATSLQPPGRLLVLMDEHDYTASRSTQDGSWFWRNKAGVQTHLVTYTEFPEMLRAWEGLVGSTLVPKKVPLSPANALALLQMRGYSFKVENSSGSSVRVFYNGNAYLKEATCLTDVVTNYLNDELHINPMPMELSRLNAEGYEIHRDEEGRWQWYGPEEGDRSIWFHTADIALQDWITCLANTEAMRAEEENLPKAGTPDAQSVRIAALQHYLQQGHREAARDNLPANISIAPDAKVEIAYDDKGRVLGCHVAATVFVSLAPANA